MHGTLRGGGVVEKKDSDDDADEVEMCLSEDAIKKFEECDEPFLDITPYEIVVTTEVRSKYTLYSIPSSGCHFVPQFVCEKKFSGDEQAVVVSSHGLTTFGLEQLELFTKSDSSLS